MRRLALLSLFLLSAGPLAAQTVATNPVHFVWDPNPPDQQVAGYRLVVDSTIHDVGGALTFTTTVPAGDHVAAVLAYTGSGQVSPPAAPLAFLVNAQNPGDPACTPPLGTHAPAIFPTSPTVTTGRPGSRSFLNYQLGGPDRVVEIAIVIDGVDQLPIGKASGPTDDLKDFSGRWFVQPAVGTHTLAVRLVTSFGCALTRQTAFPLVVKP